MEDYSLFSASSANTDLIHFGLSLSLSSGLKAVSSFSRSVHTLGSMFHSSGVQCLSPDVARGVLFVAMFAVGVSSPVLNPKMPESLRAFGMPLMLARGGSASRSPTVVRTRWSFLLYSAYVNLVPFDAILIASVIFAGVQLLVSTLLPFSTDFISSLCCLVCGVKGAEGAPILPSRGPGNAFLLLVYTSLKQSVLIPAATIADQTSCFFSLTASLSFPLGAGAVAGLWAGTRAGVGEEGLGF